MGRPRKNIVQQVEKMEESVHKISQDAPKAPEREYAPARLPQNVLRAEPKVIKARRSIKVKTIKKLEGAALKERDRMWEYTPGIFENRAIIGESMVFWQNPYPGDDYAEWVIPCNVLISVPRWVAKHLNERTYCTFKYKDRPASALQADAFIEEFVPDQINHRTSFMPVGMY